MSQLYRPHASKLFRLSPGRVGYLRHPIHLISTWEIQKKVLTEDAQIYENSGFITISDIHTLYIV